MPEYEGLQELIEALGWSKDAAAVVILLGQWQLMSAAEVYKLAKLIDSFDRESPQPRIYRREDACAKV